MKPARFITMIPSYMRAGACCALLALSSAWVTCTAAQEMSANETKGTNISGRWRGSQGLVTKGADGKVLFLYGEVQPSVVCSPLQVCDIELQAGERLVTLWERLHGACRACIRSSGASLITSVSPLNNFVMMCLSLHCTS